MDGGGEGEGYIHMLLYGGWVRASGVVVGLGV